METASLYTFKYSIMNNLGYLVESTMGFKATSAEEAIEKFKESFTEAGSPVPEFEIAETWSLSN